MRAADRSWRLGYAEGAASGGCGCRATTLAAEGPAAAAVGAVAELVAAGPAVADAEDAARVAAEPAAAGDGTSSSRRAQSWWAEACRWWRGIGSPC
jgi:hypothetical protein